LIKPLTLFGETDGPLLFPDLLLADWSTPFSAASCWTARISGEVAGTVSELQPASVKPATTMQQILKLTTTLEIDWRKVIELGSPRCFGLSKAEQRRCLPEYQSTDLPFHRNSGKNSQPSNHRP
jgi:hypothetical protein